MIEVKDISVEKFFLLDESQQKIFYNIFHKLQMTEDYEIDYKDLYDLTFDEVELLKKRLVNFNNDTVSVVWEIMTGKDFDGKTSIFDLVFIWGRAVAVINKVSELEKNIKVNIDERLLMAGVDEFRKLGAEAVKIQLGRQFGKRPKDIGEWKWTEVYTIRVYNSIENNIQYNLKQMQNAKQ